MLKFFTSLILFGIGVVAAPIPATSTTAEPTNLQTFAGSLGGVEAPPVYQEGSTWTMDGQSHNSILDAISQSCYYQTDKCQLAANQSGNVAPLTVETCNGEQIQQCLAAAQFAEPCP